MFIIHILTNPSLLFIIHILTNPSLMFIIHILTNPSLMFIIYLLTNPSLMFVIHLLTNSSLLFIIHILTNPSLMFIIHLLTNLSRKALTRGKELYCTLAKTQGIHYMNTNRLKGRSGTLNLAEKIIKTWRHLFSSTNSSGDIMLTHVSSQLLQVIIITGYELNIKSILLTVDGI